MVFKKTLTSIILAGALGLTGCSKEYKIGTVEKEFGNVAQIVESKGAIFGNESIKFGNPTYILQIKTEDGETYTASIKSCGKRRVEAIALALKEGDRVRFVVNDPINGYSDSGFGNDKVELIYADQIEILKKE